MYIHYSKQGREKEIEGDSETLSEIEKEREVVFVRACVNVVCCMWIQTAASEHKPNRCDWLRDTEALIRTSYEKHREREVVAGGAYVRVCMYVHVSVCEQRDRKHTQVHAPTHTHTYTTHSQAQPLIWSQTSLYRRIWTYRKRWIARLSCVGDIHWHEQQPKIK